MPTTLGMCLHGPHETDKQRLWTRGARFEFGMELTAQHPGVVAQLGNFHQAAVGREAAEHQAGLLQDRAIGVVELEAVTVTLEDHVRAVRVVRPGTGQQAGASSR